MNCQKCRQPLLGRVEDSLAALSHSAYDIVGASITDRRAPTHQPPDLSRLAPSLRPLYNTTLAQRAYATPSTSAARSLPPVRVQSPYSAPAHHPHHQLGPAESFVVLTESVVRPARTASAAEDNGVQNGGGGASAGEGGSPPPPLTERLAQLDNLYSILSANSGVDHPLCTECMDGLLGMMSKELDESKKEKERLVAYEREVAKRREEGVVGKDALAKEIAKLKRAEAQAVEDLKSLSSERQQLDAEKETLDAEEAALDAEEAAFWRSHSEYLIEAGALRDQNNSLQTRYAHDVRELDKLVKTNVYNDAFCIGHELGFGTINKLRFGRLPGYPVEWPEINAAWGHTILLLHTIARKFGFTFETYRLVPMGSFSRVEKISGDKATYDLYGSGDFNAVTRLLQNRRFDNAMVAFLDCLRQIMEFVRSKDKSVKIPHVVHKDKIGDVSIKYQFGTDEAWTRALRHVLFDLKILLVMASKDVRPQA
ncbi:hypothetical protein RQP46_001670 [Phenoliferia psychrophenolica]